VEYPAVVGRAFLREENRHSVDVRMSDKPDDVFYMDLKPGEQLTDEEAIAVAEYLEWARKRHP
jgi:hypothetical protein